MAPVGSRMRAADSFVEVAIERTRLLLDSNDSANIPEIRNITSELYGRGPDLRLRQEHALGVGGWRLLKALGIQPILPSQ